MYFDLHFLPDFVMLKKWKRMRWSGHVRRREEIINSNKIVVGTPGDKIPLERSCVN